MKTIIGRCVDCGDNEQRFVLYSTGKCEIHSAKKKPKKPIKKVSDKLKRDLIIYKIERLKYLEDHPVCEVDGCNFWATDIHHKKGRDILLLIQSFWMAVCRHCHRRITDDSAWAIKNKYSLKRNVK